MDHCKIEDEAWRPRGSPKRNEIAAPACHTANRRGVVIEAERSWPPRRLRKNWQRGDYTPYAIVLMPRSTLVLNEGTPLVLDNLSGLGRDGYHSCQKDESGEWYFHMAQHNPLPLKEAECKYASSCNIVLF
jgi:hypothetical protein